MRLLLILAAFAGFVWFVTTYIIDLEAIMDYVFFSLPDSMVITTLFISECFLGILPPDLYILWARTFDDPYFMVFILASVSYLGGIISWFIGKQIYRIPQVQIWVHKKFSELFRTFKKYGGLLIFISAMAPLPFSPVSTVAGVVNYPFGKYLIIALSRFLRFFLYAYVLYRVV